MEVGCFQNLTASAHGLPTVSALRGQSSRPGQCNRVKWSWCSCRRNGTFATAHVNPNRNHQTAPRVVDAAPKYLEIGRKPRLLYMTLQYLEFLMPGTDDVTLAVSSSPEIFLAFFFLFCNIIFLLLTVLLFEFRPWTFTVEVF